MTGFTEAGAGTGRRRKGRIKTAIVGGGVGCEHILRMVEDDALGRFNMEVLGVADTDPSAPGLAYAARAGIRTVSDFHELFEIPGLELVIELTGSWEVRDRIERSRPRDLRLIDHFGARLFWDLHQAEEQVLRERIRMQQRVSQIFDGIPDEIVVLDKEMVVQDANASYLRNNRVTLGEVRGCVCYEVPQAVRGECQVAVEDCPFFSAIRERRPISMVRKHFDGEGNARYAAIVAAPLLDPTGEPVGVIEMTRDITHRIMLEEQLKATEVHLHQFMEMAPIATWVKNRNLQYLEANPATLRLLGREKSEVIGKTDLEIMARPAAEAVRSHERRVLQEKCEVSFDAELEISGRRVFVSAVVYPVLDADGSVRAVCGLVRDVTHQRETEAELQRTREYLENILENSPVMIITTDLEHRVASFNRTAVETLGYAPEEIIGKPATMLYEDPEARSPIIRGVEQHGVVHEHEATLLHKDGTRIPVAITLSALLDNEGNRIGHVGISRDISRRKALMDQILQSERMAAIGRLAAGVAHEINNPLAVISETMGFLEDILEGHAKGYDVVAELRAGLPSIKTQIGRARSITRRLLSFARKTEETLASASISAALDEVLPFLEKEARLAQVQIHREYQAELPRVVIEEVQLEEIFINIIRNAIQAMEPVGRGNVWLESDFDDNRVVFTVRDDGPGIPEDVQARLFDPFYTTKPPGRGTGLGLSICYGIVKRHDGEIRVDSEPGRGARFQIILKRVAGSQAPAPQREAGPA